MLSADLLGIALLGGRLLRLPPKLVTLMVVLPKPTPINVVVLALPAGSRTFMRSAARVTVAVPPERVGSWAVAAPASSYRR